MFTYARTFNAPLTKVWDCYTREEHLAKWWGPKGFTFLSCKVDMRPAGTFHYGMQGPDGAVMWGMLRYREVVPYQKLVFITEFSDEEGNATRHPLAATWPLQTMTIATFTEAEGKTTISFEVRPIEASQDELQTFASAHGGMNVGTNGMFDMLDDYLTSTMG
ncbi:MAG: SRPBCC domain-containing protein [Candidatus Kapabacteria bacterium]|nr:SRPBCC domain-containing protein [Ignavibacteria bacterium]MBK6418923.1 SRPBCC domain-containing protein [Ignavibacteria bacterium]MBK7411829.1 SRPBCC domain-containing protein [Ignavibacteria bacterium]MBP6509562.1 SRPBCC domain-containing protein [Candidatus Kapabacteria bacterium]